MARIGQRITPFLWYDDNAEEAAKFYAAVLANSRILSVTRYNADMGSARVMAAVMKMKKLDLPTLRRAYEDR